MGQVTLTTAEYNAMLLENIRMKLQLSELVTVRKGWDDRPEIVIETRKLHEVIKEKFDAHDKQQFKSTYILDSNLENWYNSTSDSMFVRVDPEDEEVED